MQVEADIEIDERKLKEALQKVSEAQQEAVETDERKRKYNSFAVGYAIFHNWLSDTCERVQITAVCVTFRGRIRKTRHATVCTSCRSNTLTLKCFRPAGTH